MLDPTTIFQRTHAGREEIQQKKKGLTQSERLVLIMIDGVTSYTGVRKKLPVLTDDRFERAVRTLQQKELILEVLMPVEDQSPENLERSIIDRFLQQDPLDPVTILMLDPEEYLGDSTMRTFRTSAVANPVDPRPSVLPVTESELSTQEDSSRESSNAQPEQAGPSPQENRFSTTGTRVFDDADAEAAEQIGREARARAREQKILQRPAARVCDTPNETTKRKPVVGEGAHWSYWLLAIGVAFVAGYALARIGA